MHVHENRQQETPRRWHHRLPRPSRHTRAVRGVSSLVAGFAGLVVLLGAPAAMAASSGHNGHHDHHRQHKVAAIRKATDKFHSIKAATKAGYVPFKDVNGISCIDEPGMGGMGVHYVNPKLIANPKIDPRKPEALVYAPTHDGKLRLVALEYLVDKATWDKKHHSAPAIFKHHAFDETDAPNRFGLPDFYSQHVWAWKHNPAGLLAMWNPNVVCPPAS